MSKLLRKLLLIGLLLPTTLWAHGGEEKPLSLDSLTVNQRRELRGLTTTSNTFVPKGQWIFGGSASYSTHNNSDYDVLVVEDFNSTGYTLKVTPFIGYAVSRNMAIGARFIYSRSLLKVDGVGVSMGDEETGVSITVEDYYVLRHSYEGALVWRNYIPLGQNKRFGILIDTQLSAGGLQGKYAEGYPVRGTYESGYSLGLGVTPGLIAFATNNVALEVTVGVLGLSYSHLDQVRNQVYEGSRSTSDLSFKINLLAIGLGVSFHL